ncbi:MAG: hypothetical protein ACLFUJ_06500 [Phycisphaerae bacterium]
MAKDIQQKISELEQAKSDLDEQIAALKKAARIMGHAPASGKSQAKVANKKKKLKKRNKRSRRSEKQKAKDLQKIESTLPAKADDGLSIRDLAGKINRDVDVTLRNDVKELLDANKIKKKGQRVKTRYYK